MAETILFLVFCLAVFGLIGLNVFLDDAEDFWPHRPEKGRFFLKNKKKAEALPSTPEEIRAFLAAADKKDREEEKAE